MKRRIINIAFLAVLTLFLTLSGIELRGQSKGKGKGNQGCICIPSLQKHWFYGNGSFRQG